MAQPSAPLEDDPTRVRRIVLHGVVTGRGLDDIAIDLAPLHRPHQIFPGDVLLDLAADALEHSGASRANPVEFDQIRERFLPERTHRTKADHHKSKWTIRAATMIRAGVDPAIDEEVGWWYADDFWQWALDAFAVLLRAAADHTTTTPAVVARALAARHGIDLDIVPKQ